MGNVYRYYLATEIKKNEYGEIMSIRELVAITDGDYLEMENTITDSEVEKCATCYIENTIQGYYAVEGFWPYAVLIFKEGEDLGNHICEIREGDEIKFGAWKLPDNYVEDSNWPGGYVCEV